MLDESTHKPVAKTPAFFNKFLGEEWALLRKFAALMLDTVLCCNHVEPGCASLPFGSRMSRTNPIS
jgi:hypothetical protein